MWVPERLPVAAEESAASLHGRIRTRCRLGECSWADPLRGGSRSPTRAGWNTGLRVRERRLGWVGIFIKGSWMYGFMYEGRQRMNWGSTLASQVGGWCVTYSNTLPSTDGSTKLQCFQRTLFITQLSSAASNQFASFLQALPVNVDTSWQGCWPTSLRFPGEARWRGCGATSRAPGSAPSPSWREKTDWESRWACGSQEGEENGAGGGEEEDGGEARWDSLTEARGFRMKAKLPARCPTGGLRPPSGSGRSHRLPGHQAQFGRGGKDWKRKMEKH